ncbi:2,3-dihydro-2,3-dihydroxybenzoate dehydrogenase [Vibrio tapetis]|uniref:2,3-dihydro-2,3-dihydroxybenzoate dehydrogenase n=1 Tax=Vibrio tapetis subsp. tapetis TaxID=1671868 RepID=A0A2N8ZM52_9VIBR|nr:2,3-dihydro-2,3-dihydroxybenzoate dehydrogenase [Vibrio tapetis]SON52988.1 2,3-dihydro-2,3-dihydroxybenzoate dehydrogenase [Vibrio tapetis subsp. tapetis]
MMDAEKPRTLTLITGAASGIGKACAKAVLTQDEEVILLDKDNEQLLAFYESLTAKQQDKAHLYSVDLNDLTSVSNFCQSISEKGLTPNNIISAAGILHLSPILELSAEQLTDTLNTNFIGTFVLLQHLAKTWVTNHYPGSLVVVGSNAADTPRVNMSAYCASKASLHIAIKCMGLELAQYGIRCNIVSPGSTRTSMQEQLWQNADGEQLTIQGNLEQHKLGIPLGKIAEPDDIVNAVLFLLSEKAGHITMQDLRVDGGATL